MKPNATKKAAPKPVPANIAAARNALEAAQRELDAAAKAGPTIKVIEVPAPRRPAVCRASASTIMELHAQAARVLSAQGILFNHARIVSRDHGGVPGASATVAAALLDVARRAATSIAEYETFVLDPDHQLEATRLNFEQLRQALTLATQMIDAIDPHAA